MLKITKTLNVSALILIDANLDKIIGGGGMKSLLSKNTKTNSIKSKILTK